MKRDWIKIEERLPDNEGYQLVYTKDGDFDFAWYSLVRNKWYCYSFDSFDESNSVTHWQPLVKPE